MAKQDHFLNPNFQNHRLFMETWEVCENRLNKGYGRKLKKSGFWSILRFWIQKQTKNRNETGSNLSLDTRVTVLAKRLGRKRCRDTTPDRCLECCRLTMLTAHC